MIFYETLNQVSMGIRNFVASPNVDDIPEDVAQKLNDFRPEVPEVVALADFLYARKPDLSTPLMEIAGAICGLIAMYGFFAMGRRENGEQLSKAEKMRQAFFRDAGVPPISANNPWIPADQDPEPNKELVLEPVSE